MATHTGLQCDRCESALYGELGKFTYECKNGHKIDANAARGTCKMMKAVMPKAEQKDRQTINLEAPVMLVQRLTERYGEKLSATVEALLYAAAEPNTVILGSMDVEKAFTLLETQFKSGAELCGAIFSLKEQLRIANEKASNVAVESDPFNKLKIDVSSFEEQLLQLAEDRGVTPRQLCENIVRMGIENGWV